MSATTPRLVTLPKLSPTGAPATLRVVLPPNLAAAAARDAVAVRFEISIAGRGQFPASLVPDERALQVPPAQLSALYLIESWNQGRAVTMAQLTRAQLGALAAVLAGEPVFFLANRPKDALPWNGDRLAGVSEHLRAPEPPDGSPRTAGPAPAPTSAPLRREPPPAPRRRSPATDATPPLVDGSEHYLAIQLPSREHFAYEPLLELLKSAGFRLEPSNRKWWLRDRHKTLHFLAENWTRLRDEWGAEFTPNFERQTARLQFAEVETTIAPAGEDFEITVAVRAGAAAEREVHASLSTGRTYVEADGTVYLFDRARLEKLHTAQRAFAGSAAAPLLGRSAHRISRARVAEADAVLAELSPNLQPPEEWRRRTEIFRHPTGLSPAPAPAELDRQLRPYQRLGAAWLWHLRAAGLGGILADEMGLGKTLQALTVIAARSRASRKPCLVVCPASLLENWRREAARFTPQLQVLVHHGDARTDNAATLRAADLVVTSYGTLARDQMLFAGITWDTLVADEAQHVKNRRTQNAQALQSLPAEGRILLTGTPVENSLQDLEALFAVVLPGYLKPVPTDARGDERAWHQGRVRRQAAPYILRRTKAQVTPELPAKIEQTLFVEMTDPQRALYETTRARSEAHLLELELAGQSEGRIRVAMFTQLLRLRQVCGDPRLLEPERDPAESAKLAALLELLDEAVDDGHRVLVFSQFTSLLALVRAALEAQGTAYAYLDGTMPAKARQAEVDRFNAGGGELPVFLLSLKAGGTGLNLASADTVVHLDPWWNPAVEAQATDRAHRIGQTRVVTSYKLIAAGTVEERVLAMQDEKRKLLANVFDESDAANAALTLADVKALVAR